MSGERDERRQREDAAVAALVAMLVSGRMPVEPEETPAEPPAKRFVSE